MYLLEEKVNKIINNYKYVSFDIFDTLIFRTVKNPEDIFDIVEYRYNSILGNRKVHGFRKNRIKAERMARSLNNHHEITINRIYELLPYKSEVKTKLMDIEKQIEVENCVPNVPMIEMYNLFKNNGKKIIITTDMYLDRNTINKILSKINVYYDWLFISSEIGKTKFEGDLFPYILKNLGVNANELVHIGDNPLNDIKRAEESGICAYERIQNKFIVPQQKMKNINMHMKYFESRCTQSFKSNNVEHEIGIEVFAPIIYEFCKWVNEQKNVYKFDKIFFVAREGYIIEKCYRVLFPQDNVEYIYLNRNLLRMPLLTKKNISQQLLSTIPGQPSYLWKEILQHLDVKNINQLEEKIKEKYPQFSINTEISYSEIKNGNIESVLEYIYDFIQIQIQEQKNLLLRYLEQIGLKNNKVALVNNSINGTGQWLIEEFLGQNQLEGQIIGLQFIQSEKCAERLENRSIAWITKDSSYASFIHEFEEHAILLEHILFEPIGTAKMFELSNDDKIIVICEEQRKEKNNNNTIEMIQEAIIRYVEWMRDNIQVNLGLDSLKAYKKMLERPDYEVANILCNLYDDDVEEDRKIADSIIPYKKSYIMARGIPHTIKWVPGYLVLKNKKKVHLMMYHYRIELRELRTKVRNIRRCK